MVHGKNVAYSSLNADVFRQFLWTLENISIIEVRSVNIATMCTKTENTSGFSNKMRSRHIFVKITKDQCLIWKLSVFIGFLKGSEANRSLRYTSYYGDGDSKAFNNV
ncbi:hypothetical protein TNCV_2437311 [Trichonephila clavipes]|nr:hypothetical protein TNCV_2437311 [Trichonephila clavipes]